MSMVSVVRKIRLLSSRRTVRPLSPSAQMSLLLSVVPVKKVVTGRSCLKMFEGPLNIILR